MGSSGPDRKQPQRPASSSKQASAALVWPLILAFASGLSWVASRWHYSLPAPTGLPQTPTEPVFSEAIAIKHVQHMAGDIGYRIVGTQELADSVLYVHQVVEELKTAAKAAGSTKEIDIWHQQANGSHLFDFLGQSVWKRYYSLSNIVVRVSSPEIPTSKRNAILVNAHIDSTLPSPGAADDLVGVTSMLEALRVVINTPDWLLHNSIIFLFNGAEESLQDASVMFMQTDDPDLKPVRQSARAVINLEACGTEGPEILFQATSTEMVRAYAKVPRPYGTILATEIFQTGLILSDTDFRQFEDYGQLTGLDMALIQNSWLYHTRQDVPEALEPGAITHMGENTLALLSHLTSATADLSNMTYSVSTVFFSGLGGRLFFMYSKTAALRAYASMGAILAALIGRSIPRSQTRLYVMAALAAPASLLAGLVSANALAFFLDAVLRKPMSWYRRETFPLLVFGPPAMVGNLAVHLLLARKFGGETAVQDDGRVAHAVLTGQAAFAAVTAVAGAAFNVGSAYLAALNLGSGLLALFANDLLLATSRPGGSVQRVHVATYFLASILPFSIGVEGLLGCLDIFTPLTGRMGLDPPVDAIIASAVAFLTASISAPLVALAHRSRAGGVRLALWVSIGATIGSTLFFAQPTWATFDHAHPKRLPVLHMQNLSSSPAAFTLHVASLDRASGFEALVGELAVGMNLDASTAIAETMGEHVPDWDIVYPVSQFLRSSRIPIPSPPGAESEKWRELFTVSATSSKLDHIRQRRALTLTIKHPGIIWSVIAFDGDIVKWDLPSLPQRGRRRHHVKEASGHGIDQWTLELELQLSESEFEAAQRNEQRRKGQREGPMEHQGQLRIDYSGLEDASIFHARTDRPASDDGPAMSFFRQLDAQIPPSVDAMLLGAIANVAHV